MVYSAFKHWVQMILWGYTESLACSHFLFYQLEMEIKSRILFAFSIFYDISSSVCKEVIFVYQQPCATTKSFLVLELCLGVSTQKLFFLFVKSWIFPEYRWLLRQWQITLSA